MQRITVLIVDDDPFYQETLRVIVQKLGYEAHVCGEGVQAITFLNREAERVCLVLLDLNMPEIDGISALGHFRSKWPSIPVIIISASEDEADERIVINLGASEFIHKPVFAEGLQEKIKRYCSK